MKNNKGFGLTEVLLVLFIFLVCIFIAVYCYNEVSDDIGIPVNNNRID